MGVDAYPGTWGPALPGGDLATAVRTATRATMRRLRLRLLPRAHLSRAPIHFSESGYPTGSGRTPDMQKTVMTSAIQAIAADRGRYGVTDLRWFDLRDADSSNPSFESQYGLTTDDYSPKPAFFAFRKLIKRRRSAESRRTRCVRRRRRLRGARTLRTAVRRSAVAPRDHA